MKQLNYILFCTLFSLSLSAQIEEINVSNLMISAEDFSQIAEECIDSILNLENKSEMIYQIEISKEFTEPKHFKEILHENNFLVKSYLNFSLRDIEFKYEKKQKFESIKAKFYFDWPTIDILNDELFIRIKVFSKQFLTEYFFKIRRYKHDIQIVDLVKSLSMPHIPLQILDTIGNNYKHNKLDLIKNKALMDSISNDLKSKSLKKDKSI